MEKEDYVWSLDTLRVLDCIARDDHTIVQESEAGQHFIVVDSGHDTPGEYTLTVDFQ